jgi:hypothetical protein
MVFSWIYCLTVRNLKGLAVNSYGSTTGRKLFDDLEVLLRSLQIGESIDLSLNGKALKSQLKIKDSVRPNVLARLDNAYNGIL